MNYTKQLLIAFSMVVGFLLGFIVAMLFSAVLRHHFKTQQLQIEGLAREQKERDLFFAKLSHDLKTPLVSIQGWAQMLCQSPGSATLEKGVRAIEENCIAQSRIINDLLDSSRMKVGKFRLNSQEIDLVRIVWGTIETMRPQIEKNNLVVVPRMTGSLQGIAGDPLRVSQILTNLLTNAIKFSPRGGSIEINAGVEKIDSLTYAKIDVKDQGSGISPSFMPKIFDSYTQARQADSGLGLGLAIAKHLVELHGGKIFARSEGEGKGSVFSVLLPMNQAPESQARPPEPLKEGRDDSTSQQI